MGRPGAAHADLAVDLHGGGRPVDLELVRLDLRRVQGLAHLRRRCTEPVGQRAEEQPGTDLDEASPQLLERLVRTDVELRSAVDAARVEPLLHDHEIDAGALVAGEDRPLDGRRTAPAGQQGEVQVDHRHLGQHVRADQASEGHDHAEVHTGVEDVVDPIRHHQPQVERRRLDRRGVEPGAPASPLVGLGDDQRDLVARLDEGAQRRDRELGRAEVGEPSRPADGRRGDHGQLTAGTVSGG